MPAADGAIRLTEWGSKCSEAIAQHQPADETHQQLGAQVGHPHHAGQASAQDGSRHHKNAVNKEQSERRKIHRINTPEGRRRGDWLGRPGYEIRSTTGTRPIRTGQEFQMISLRADPTEHRRQKQVSPSSAKDWPANHANGRESLALVLRSPHSRSFAGFAGKNQQR